MEYQCCQSMRVHANGATDVSAFVSYCDVHGLAISLLSSPPR